MTALITTVFLASLLGSLHCAGMCGPFVAIAVAPRTAPGRRATLHLAYHGGRLASYAALGAVAGALGAALDFGGTLLGLQRAALVAAGAAMIAFGAVALAHRFGRRPAALRAPRFWQRWLLRAQKLGLRLPRAPRALAIGLLSTLLPCGWLYAFAVTAAGTGSPALGALTMALFWAGTLPLLVGLGVGVQRLAGPARRHAPVLAAVALMVVGLVAVVGRFQIAPLSAAGEPEASLEETAERAADLEHPPGCGMAP